MKIWQKDIASTDAVDKFTVSADRELDERLALFDILGSLAHTKMLHSIDLMDANDLQSVQAGLKELAKLAKAEKLKISVGSEDIHSEIEARLTEMVGEAGKKIHSGRSRNDQVLLDLRLFFRSEIAEIVTLTKSLFDCLQTLADKHKDVLMPGYTHLQIAMPSSFGLWFGAYAESLADDLHSLLAAYKVCNRNPLGSAAGYGSSFPLDRAMTTALLGFDSPAYNVVYAQMGRGKTERMLAQAIGNIAATLGKLAMDNALYLSQNFGFISYPPQLTTGSSIMPHKKNPDVWEIMRGKCNIAQGAANQIALLTGNLPSGYHRDLQLLKEVIFPAITSIKECLEMATYMLHYIEVKSDILAQPMYNYIFSVEAVNAMVLQGVPFRDAYRSVGVAINGGEFKPNRQVHHTHIGSIGNLCLTQVSSMFDDTFQQFDFQKFQRCQADLLK